MGGGGSKVTYKCQKIILFGVSYYGIEPHTQM